MFNPFKELPGDDPPDEDLVERAQRGDRVSLEQLVERHQAWIFNVAVRMVWDPHDAEEVTQEVLIKVLTKLGAFRGECRFRTWLYRIVANHVLTMKQRTMEPAGLTFAAYGASLDNTPELDLPDPRSVPVDLPLLVEEAKIGCTTGMLLCLDRRQRLVFTLGELLGVSDSLGAELLEVTPENFRQLLSRARRDLYSFMANKCGLVNQANRCRCARKTSGFIAAGFVDPTNLRFVPEHARRIAEVAADRCHELEELVDRQHAAIYREQPFLEPADQLAVLRRLLDSSALRQALELDN